MLDAILEFDHYDDTLRLPTWILTSDGQELYAGKTISSANRRRHPECLEEFQISSVYELGIMVKP